MSAGDMCVTYQTLLNICRVILKRLVPVPTIGLVEGINLSTGWHFHIRMGQDKYTDPFVVRESVDAVTDRKNK